MKITNKKTKKPFVPWLLVATTILLIIIGVLNWLNVGPFAANPSPQQNGPTTEEQVTQKEVADEGKKELAESNKDTELPGENISTPSTPSSIELTPTKDNGTVTIKTRLTGYAAGSCSLNISNRQKTIQQNAEIIYQPEFSTCAGFNVLISDLDRGQWQINLIVTPTGGSPITKTFEYLV